MKKVILPFLLVLSVLVNSCTEEPYVPTGAGSGSQYKQAAAGSVTFKWKVNGSNLDCELSAPGTGWVAAGFASASAKPGANIIIGYVSSSTAYMQDDYANGGMGHAADTGLGGTDDITIVSGSESGGTTTITFSIPLNSGDANDIVLAEGQQYYLLLAYHDSADDYATYHTEKGYALITL